MAFSLFNLQLRAGHLHRGCLIGLAVGDALGTALEFSPPGSFEPISDMVGGGPFHLKPGEWTDDTSMSLCLAASLVETGSFDPEDQMKRYVRWWREGYMASNGRCFDIGNTVARALRLSESTGDPIAGSTDPHSAGNGSIMRLAPVPLAFANDPERAIDLAGRSSRTTHGARECIDACRFMAGLIVGALQGRDKEELLSDGFSPIPDLWKREPLSPKIDAIANCSYKHQNPPKIRGTGYVVESLEAALWAFWRSDDFRSGALLAVNLGDDADTTGAVYGQIAGAHYGMDGIPEEWSNRIARREEIIRLADGLHEFMLAQHPGNEDV